MKWNFPAGATPLEPDEIAGLLPLHITTQSDLNEWEQNNILEAEVWVTQRQLKLETILEQTFIRTLHQRMLSKTWKWAGQFRRTDKNIGIDWRLISTQLQIMLDDARYQFKYASFSIPEIAVRFHHRLVAIHPFVNGNGRHARLITDSLLLALQQPRFTWGKSNLIESSITRSKYIEALRAADRQDYRLLMNFVSS